MRGKDGNINLPKSVYIFRHGETDWNREGRLQGSIDIPLNTKGRSQAEILRRFFERNPVDVFLSSDLSRAHETARIAAGTSGTPIVIESRLRETHLGVAEGMRFEDFIGRFGDEFYERWKSLHQDDAHVRFPEGESKAEHLARVLRGLEEFVASTEHQRIAVATHGGSMRRLIHHWAPELNEAVMVGNCVTYEATFDPAAHIWQLNKEPVLKPE